jgi:hypothetical protein
VLKKFDESDVLGKGLHKLAERVPEFVPEVELQFVFPTAFPLQPPFVRVVHPLLSHGFVMRSGAICMELLTTDGWTPANSIDSLVQQVLSWSRSRMKDVLTCLIARLLLLLLVLLPADSGHASRGEDACIVGTRRSQDSGRCGQVHAKVLLCC